MKIMPHPLRQTLRELRRSPGFAATVIATLAIGIGLNAAIFTVVDCVLLRPLGYRDAARIVALQTHFISENRSIPRLGGDDWVDLSRQVGGLEATAFYQSFDDGIELNGSALYLPVAVVSPRFAAIFGVTPVAGRLFASSTSETNEAIVSASFARDHFGSAGAAVGRSIQYLSTPRTVVGVLPDGFSFPGSTQVWFAKTKPYTASRSSFSQNAVGKRRTGVTNAQLSSELETFSSHLRQTYPEDRDNVIEAAPIQDQLVGNVRPVLRLLMGSVAVILLLVCANITHLQLVRATRRIRSIGVRTALGATRSSLALRAILETFVLASFGCIGALVLAYPALSLLLRLAPPDIPRIADIHLNFDVFLFSFLLSVLVMSLTALFPVWRSWQIDPATVLRQDASRGTENHGATRLRNSFVVVEIALTLTLSAGAVLLTRQLIRESHQGLGFRSENLIALDTHSVQGNQMPDFSAAATAEGKDKAIRIARTNLAHLASTLDSVEALPGVISAAAIDSGPMNGGSSNVSYAVEGRQVFGPPFIGLPVADIHPVTPNFLVTLGTPLLHGRGFSEDDRLGSPPVLLINQALARKVFPGENPVGRRIKCGYDSSDPDWWTIAGVVGDIRGASPGQPASPTFYVPVAQHPYGAGDMQILVRSSGGAAAMVDSLQKQLKQTHPEIAVSGTTMRENISEAQRDEKFRAVLFAGFSAVSILLALMGMYSVTAYSVAQRRFEFGLRIAVGSTRSQLLVMVLRTALVTSLTGVTAGAVLSILFRRVLGAVLGDLPVVDTLTWSLTCLPVLLVSMLAAALPAQTAAGVNPVQVLRSE